MACLEAKLTEAQGKLVRACSRLVATTHLKKKKIGVNMDHVSLNT